MPAPTQTQYTITPWRTPSDLLTIRTSLYSPSTPSEQSHAIATIQSWKLRGNVPHAVESSAQLFSALLFHSQLTATTTTTTTTTDHNPADHSSSSLDATTSFALRAAYTTALSRFVTGFADLGRHRSGPGQSMFDVARSISLPAHFVELRHEVAHEDMPGLARLVRCAREAVDWLWGVYWARLGGDEVQQQLTGGVGTAGEGKERIRVVLKEFKSGRVAGLKAKGKEKPSGSEFAKQTVLACGQCVEVCSTGNGGRESWEHLVEILVDEGMIVPSSKKRGPLPDASLQGAYMLWDELLQMLAKSSPFFLEVFLERAVAHNAEFTSSEDDTDRSSPAEWAIFRWILHVLNSPEWSETREKTPLDLKCVVLRECALYPNAQWSLDLAEEILEDADKHIRSTWSQLMDVSALDEEQGEEGHAEQEASLTSNPNADALMEDASSDCGGWRQGVQPWKPVPLGVVQT